MSLTDECFAPDTQDRNPDYVPEPAQRCTCCIRRGVRLICGLCAADRDWKRWVLEATVQKRGGGLA